MTRLPKPPNDPAKATTPSWTAETDAPSGAAISCGHDRPIEVAAERPNRQRGRVDGGADGEFAKRRLQLLLRGLQLGDQLGVQIAPRVDVVDEIVAGARRLRQRGLGPFGI